MAAAGTDSQGAIRGSHGEAVPSQDSQLNRLILAVPHEHRSLAESSSLNKEPVAEHRFMRTVSCDPPEQLGCP